MGDTTKAETGGRREMRVQGEKAEVSEVECRGEAMGGERSRCFGYLMVA